MPCPRGRAPGSLFCRHHEQAPAAQRGGWLSAERRRRKLAASDELRLEASNVSPKLWVGSRPPVDRDLPAFDVVALCAVEVQPDMGFHGRLIRCPIPDAVLSINELSRAIAASKQVAESLLAGKRVLVTCHAGLNRSAFVACLALSRVTTMGASDLISLMRTRRSPAALSNQHFLHLLHHLVGEGRENPQRQVGSRRRRRRSD